MGECFGCNKKLGLFEGYSSRGKEFCKNCFPKSKDLLKKEGVKEEKIEIKEREKSDRDDLKEKKATKIFKIFGKEGQKKELLKIINILSKEKEKKILIMFEKYHESYRFSWGIRIISIILWLYLGKNLIFGLTIFFVFIPISSFIAHLKKTKLRDELKKVV